MNYTSYPNRETWLAARRNSLGSSDAAAVIGLSPWSDPLTVFNEKAHGIKANGDKVPLRFRVGLELEGLLADLVREQRPDWTVIRNDQWMTYHHRTHPYLSATPDCVGYDDDGRPGVVELKTAKRLSDWRDGPPDHYLVQVQHQLMCTGLEWAAIGVLIDNDRFELFDVQRFERLIDDIRRVEAKFWINHVRPKVAPKANGSPSSAKALALLHPKDNGETIELDATMAEIHEELEDIKEQQQGYSARRIYLETMIKGQMKDATYATIPGVEGRYSWKHQTVRRKACQAKVIEQRVFRKVG